MGVVHIEVAAARRRRVAARREWTERLMVAAQLGDTAGVTHCTDKLVTYALIEVLADAERADDRPVIAALERILQCRQRVRRNG